MKNLAPQIFRQRLIIEALYKELPTKERWEQYLKELSDLLDMEIVHGPFVHNWAEEAKPKEFGAWEWFAIWTTSWVHMYTREKLGKLLTVDIYTCKEFDPKVAVEFTKTFFDLKEIVYNDNR